MNDIGNAKTKTHCGTEKTVQWDLLGKFLQTHTAAYIDIDTGCSENLKPDEGEKKT